ncbi:cation diffusion facilitator family transporter [Chamaesiphon minutus]|uniref:Cation diffusion facilitator family transporter n=1 Tax=Chamaesiphon minutus (strain ATCC 27169 / PCC 6605) TaxID=1173020 RepID=K9UC52_CHAP6|nr:cation diffusion facilitator family transporter [Chamaesiphon minutus]AFY91769.1 cation diffusion facilitator family transporter [Chamaesiphon minutus PCC 6605]
MSFQTARPYTLLSIGAALMTIALKTGAYFLTGSVGLLSDALESGINLVAALAAFWALSFAATPADEDHPFGHNKAEYFSSGLESILIVVAAIGIAVVAVGRLSSPQPLEQLGVGLFLTLIATAINGGVAWILLRAGKRLRSITLRADAHHLFTDVWTSGGVILGILLVKLTGWLILDPIIALCVAASILVSGAKLLQETGAGLLDTSLPLEERDRITNIFSRYEPQGIHFHALRTRVSGSRRFVTFHVLVPGSWTVQQGHDLCEDVEEAIVEALPGANVVSHMEPLEDPKSWTDLELDRSIDR